jgi:hypothetical protein
MTCQIDTKSLQVSPANLVLTVDKIDFDDEWHLVDVSNAHRGGGQSRRSEESIVLYYYLTLLENNIHCSLSFR